MFCGSCMHDNTLARAMLDRGHDAVLVPCYTPIRVDEADVSESRVFLGGVNLYLDHVAPLWRRMPRLLRGLLDRPGVLRRIRSSSDASELGELTIETLRGEDGPLAAELPPLVDYLTAELRPDAILFSNALLGGVLPTLRAAFDGPIGCLLQGDDIFLDALPARHREAAIALVSQHAAAFDVLLTHSRFYADKMAGYLSQPADRFAVVPLGIDVDSFAVAPRPDTKARTVGFFARRAPEKGLHRFVDAAVRLAGDGRREDVVFRIGGYQHAKDRAYAAEQFERLADAGCRVDDVGSPDTHEAKLTAIAGCDLFSVPTEYEEPKGLSILEAMACGVPVVQPAHGAFPERIAATGGGVLVPPDDAAALAAAWGELLDDDARREGLSAQARRGVAEAYGLDAMVRETVAAIAP